MPALPLSSIFRKGSLEGLWRLRYLACTLIWARNCGKTGIFYSCGRSSWHSSAAGRTAGIEARNERTVSLGYAALLYSLRCYSIYDTFNSDWLYRLNSPPKKAWRREKQHLFVLSLASDTLALGINLSVRQHVGSFLLLPPGSQRERVR